MPFIIALIVLTLGAGVYFFTSLNTPNRDSDQNTVVNIDHSNAVANKFRDGEYVGENTYPTPSGNHTITVNLTLRDDIVTAVSNSYDESLSGTSAKITERFEEIYQAEVVGKKLEEVNLSRVAGASTTSDAFNSALAEIKTKATI